MAKSEVECFSGVKTAQNSKTGTGTERTKKTKCEAEGRRCAWGDFTSRKTRRMHRAEMASLPRSQGNRKENAAVLPLIFYKCQTRGVPEVICAQRCTTNCTSHHNSRWLLDLSPQTIPQMRALSLGPRLSLFSVVSYWSIISVRPSSFHFVG